MLSSPVPGFWSVAAMGTAQWCCRHATVLVVLWEAKLVALVGEREACGSCGSRSVHGGPRDDNDAGLVGRSVRGGLVPGLVAISCVRCGRSQKGEVFGNGLLL